MDPNSHESETTADVILQPGGELDDSFAPDSGIAIETLRSFAGTWNLAVLVYGPIHLHPRNRIPTDVWVSALEALSLLGGPVLQEICDAKGNVEGVNLVANSEAVGDGYQVGQDDEFDVIVEQIGVDGRTVVLKTLAEWDCIKIVKR